MLRIQPHSCYKENRSNWRVVSDLKEVEGLDESKRKSLRTGRQCAANLLPFTSTSCYRARFKRNAVDLFDVSDTTIPGNILTGLQC